MKEPREIKVGDIAKVASVLRPGGFVLVHGERHSARCAGGYLEVGTDVVVTGGDNHGFVVIEFSETIRGESLPDFGKPVYSSFGDSARAAAVEAERQLRLWLGKRRKWRLWVGPAVGLIFAVVGVVLTWETLVATHQMQNAKTWAVAGLLGAGAFCGLGLLWVFDWALIRIDFDSHRFSLGITAMTLAGITAGLVWAVPRFGVLWGILAATVQGFLAGIPFVVGITIIAGGGSPGKPGLK